MARLVLLVLSLVLLASSHVVHGQQGATNGQWRATGGDAAQTRYSPLDQITRDNVKDLKVAWTFRMDNFSSPPEARSQTSPVMANGRLFFTAGAQRAVVAVDAGSGEALWLWKNDEGVRAQKAPRRGSGRGVAYWSDGREERIFSVKPDTICACCRAQRRITTRSLQTIVAFRSRLRKKIWSRCTESPPIRSCFD